MGIKPEGPPTVGPNTKGRRNMAGILKQRGGERRFSSRHLMAGDVQSARGRCHCKRCRQLDSEIDDRISLTP